MTYFWIPILVLLQYTIAYHTVHFNFFPLLGWLMVPLWVLPAYLSQDLPFDALLYDSIAIVAFLVSLMILGEGAEFRWINWIGATLALCGIIMVKI